MQTAHDSGVLSWVTSGRCDLVADIRFPREGEQELDLSALVADIVDKFGEIGQHLHVGPQLADTRIPGRGTLSRNALEVPKGWGDKGAEREKHWGDRLEERVEEGRDRWRGAFEKDRVGETLDRVEQVKVAAVDEVEPKERTVSIDLDIRFKDLKAHVPVRRGPLLLRWRSLMLPTAVLHHRHFLRQQRAHPAHRRVHQLEQDAHPDPVPP